MTDYLLMAIIVLLALDVLINVSAWSRRSALCNRVAYWARQQGRAWRSRRARGRRNE